MMMSRFMMAALAALALWFSPPVAAQPVPVQGSPARDDSLFRALGGEDGIRRVVNDLVDRAVQDPRIAHQFKNTKPQGLKDSLTEQVCAASGGPCIYQGAKMKPAHADLGITRAEFHALVEDLQDAMTAQRVPFAVQNRLLAILAPMHRDIIARP